MDLYDVLGVTRRADAKTVHAAYRARSKRAHPDSGGSAEKFAQVRLARDVLTDPRRRERYDRDGTIEETVPDNHEASVRQCMLQLFQATLAEVLKSNQDPERLDLAEMTRQMAQAKIAEHETAIEQNRRGANQLTSLAKRFRSRKKGKPCVMEQLLQGHADQVQQGIARLEAQLATIREAKKELEHVAFDHDPVQYVTMQMGYPSASTLWVR